MSRISHKTLALVATATIAAASPLALMPAVAQETTTTTRPAPTSGIDLNAKATLTIEKRIGEVGSTQNAPSGFEFKVEMIKLASPLNTAEGWTEAQSIIAGRATATVEEEQTVTTDNDGIVSASIPVGLYRITEVQNGSYTVAAPFFVTVPLIEEDGTVNYNPTISPKNQELKPTKSAVDTNVGVGDNITYTIKAPVPAGDALRDGTRTISQFRIEDPLVSELQYVADSAQVTLTGVTNGAEATLAAGDYTVTSGQDNKLAIEFTGQGRAKLASLRADNPGLTAQVVFDAKVLRLPANGQLNNQANVYIPNATDPVKTTPEDSSQQGGDNTSTSTQYVDVEVRKTLDSVDSAAAAGAQFNIVGCTKASNNRYTIKENSTPLVGTNQAGTEKVTGPITAVAANSVSTAAGFGMQFTRGQEYCAVETKAPAGYLLNPDPTPLALTPGGTSTARPIYTATVNDVKDNIFGRLPATGTTTMLAMLAIGLVLFGGGAAYQLRRKNA
ncbi:Fimbrial subunit type 1 precursor [Corynebacterium capitovis DSM 44611]|uniref:SpaH/EbpB family LPXTG-anchored major pilin n=1 Tax=Corynebacterium capitovis TaxID=131081 RepID=UPI00037BD85A|nr:SpaH/EbpB family LPXTG-anchored major pilin [Corynebacterium capitovis]WKD58179.1 Fimbrial subunit type 1 precursor [Corynebacterium capitovis DSM 44611]